MKFFERTPSSLRLTALALAVAFPLTSCASDLAEPAASATASTTIDLETTSTSLASTTTTTTPPPETTAMTDPAPTPKDEAAGPTVRCDTITNFESIEANEQWVVVNDGVMGGRSFGDRTFTDSTMVFAGEIDTNGGGFSSLRLPLEPGVLTGYDRVVLRARADARNYMLTFDDSLPGRDRRVSFRAPIEFSTPGEWETVSVSFDELFPAAFGTPVIDDAFRADLATRIGIMLSDGIDGEFSLEIDTIEVCGPAEPT